VSKNVLAVAVHPDDETLGCGGTLLKHKADGDNIHWLVCTTVKGLSDENMVLRREKEIEKVSKMYNFNSVQKLDFITTKVDEYNMSDLISSISDVVNTIRPDTVYLPFKGDVHSDHRKIFEAAYACTKSFRYPFIKKILMMEVLSETEFAPSTKEDGFIPNVFVDISSYFDKKIEIMKVFESELGNHPFPRSIQTLEALALLRGAMSNCKYAESFVLLKEIR